MRRGWEEEVDPSPGVYNNNVEERKNGRGYARGVLGNGDGEEGVRKRAKKRVEAAAAPAAAPASGRKGSQGKVRRKR